jgi:hypothetical protein
MPTPKQLVLPFAAQSENRKEPLSNEAEAAAIYALAELERKSGGITNKQEKIAYITKIGYPLWLITKGETTYVFDGLNKSSYLWNYYEEPHAKFMLDDFEANFKIREAYQKLLANFQRNFQQELIKKELSCGGLIANSEFLTEMDAYRKEATDVYSQLSSLGLLLPALEETKAADTVNRIEELQSEFREKTEKLKQLTQLITKTTNGFVEGLRFEADAVAEEAGAKIKAQKEIISPKIEKLTREYGSQISGLENSIDKEKLPLEKQKSHLEKTIKSSEANVEQYKKQVKIQAGKHNAYSEMSLKKKIKKEKQELDELKKHLNSFEKRLKTLADHKADETLRLRREFDAKVKLERQPIVALEIARDEKLSVFKQDIQKLEKLTKPVQEELSRFVKQREAILAKSEPLGVKSDPKLKNSTLLYAPFYVAAYSGADSKRYFIVPPSLVGSLGFSAKLKSALGRAKIRDLLSPRFKAMSFLAEKIRLNTYSSSEFEIQIEALAQKNSILSPDLAVRNGLFLLKGEGWLSDDEYQNFLASI